jgi:uncharacterized protein (TIGR04551 family)
MIRRLAALAAALLLASPALAQEGKKAEPAPEKKGETPPAPELDPKTKAAIAREVEKAKEEIRDEVRAEMQGAQSAAEFLGAVAEGPKLEFLELDGYLRFRGQLADNLLLSAGTDAFGYYYYPAPIFQPGDRSTLATANMRLRVEPTLNVSEHVRIRAQLDVLDNYAYGSGTSGSPLFDAPFSPYPVPFYGSSRVTSSNDPRLDRDPIQPKRVWGEVQTPVGLLSFGRMPSAWGLGILTHAGGGIDDDYGDTVDRLQFALAPVQTPLGPLNLVPILQFDDEGVLYADQRFPGQGQPFDADSEDDGRTFALKVARVDTEDELRRKLEAGRSSLNFGAYYNYQVHRNHFPQWNAEGYAVLPDTALADAGTQLVERKAYNHVLDLWFRVATPRLRIEVEGAGVYGHVGEAGAVVPTSETDPTLVVRELGDIDLRQWGAALVTDYKAIPNKVSFGLDGGIASGDSAPGFGNIPNRFRYVPPTADPNDVDGFVLPPLGSIEGPQFGRAGDSSIRNFRFNPAYRIDLVLWRNILGQVTDAWYLRPHLRWDILPGLAFDTAVIYSMALYGESTPSAREAQFVEGVLIAPEFKGDKALGIEGDVRLSYSSGDGFGAWVEWGVFQPLDGMGKGLDRGHVLNAGLAIKF